MGSILSEQEELCSTDAVPVVTSDGATPEKQRPLDSLSGIVEHTVAPLDTVSGADIDASTSGTGEACSIAATSEDEGEGVGVCVIERDIWPKQLSEELSGPRVDPQHTGIIFDWDDTLLPTSFMEDAIKMCPTTCGPPARLRSHRRSSSRSARGSCISKDFPCYAALQRHAELVQRVLWRASSLGRVAIVTSASRPWVFESAEKYLPEVDMAGLFQDLKIPVYYAGEHRCPKAGSEGAGEELDRQSALKRNAMSEFLQSGSASPDDEQGCTNVLSIGDSAAERHAAKAAAAGAAGCPEEPRRRLCKTVKLMCDPSLKQLSDQLQILEGYLEALASCGVDIDLSAGEPSELAEQAEALLGV